MVKLIVTYNDKGFSEYLSALTDITQYKCKSYVDANTLKIVYMVHDVDASALLLKYKFVSILQ